MLGSLFSETQCTRRTENVGGTKSMELAYDVWGGVYSSSLWRGLETLPVYFF